MISAYKEAIARGIKEEVSSYAGKNIHEFIAECWAESFNSDSPRPFAASAAEIIRKRYSAKYPA
jgi:hypothetical protein